MRTAIKMDGTTKLYDRAPKDGKIHSMLFVYENAAGERYASNVCDFDLINKGYEQTGEVVYGD